MIRVAWSIVLAIFVPVVFLIPTFFPTIATALIVMAIFMLSEVSEKQEKLLTKLGDMN
jgi:hypothetical protein